MARQMKKKARVKSKDRISKLPDELIHQIMSCLDIRFAIQTSILSKRWKLLWTTLPFLNFHGYEKHYSSKKLVYYKILKNTLFYRNHEYPTFKLDLHPPDGLKVSKLKKVVQYAISHHVERMNIRSRRYCSLSAFHSNSLKELKLTMNFESDNVMASDCWTLPNLTTLLLKSYNRGKFPESCLICLPALTTLVLNKCVLPDFFSLPALKILCLESCSLPPNGWDFPALLTLQLTNVRFPKDVISEYILALASLRDLTIDFGETSIGCCNISSPGLVNLKIRARLNIANASQSQGKIVVCAPKLCNFNAIGFFWTTFIGSDQLKELNVKFWDWTMYRANRAPSWVLEKHTDLFKFMFSQLGSAENLSFDLVTLQALSEISDDILETFGSPFYNLKYLKLPHKCEESCISSSVRKYLLGSSPSATIVKA